MSPSGSKSRTDRRQKDSSSDNIIFSDVLDEPLHYEKYIKQNAGKFTEDETKRLLEKVKLDLSNEASDPNKNEVVISALKSLEASLRPVSIAYRDNENGKEVIDYYETAKNFKAELHIYNLKDSKGRAITECYYDQGIYKDGAKDKIFIVVEGQLRHKASRELKNELYQHIRDQGFEYFDSWISKCNPHIVVNNGVVNLDKVATGDYPLEEWTPEYHSFNKIDVDYSPEAEGENFKNHIESVIPDESDRDRFHKFVGSFLETDNYAHQKIMILFGAEGSGKTVTLRTFTKFFGLDNITAKSFQQLSEGRFDIADLFKAMANICEELPQSAIHQIEKLNSLTGGLVNGEKKNRDPFAFYQNAKLGAACNDLPEIKGDSTTIRAFMSRVVIINFDKVIRGTDKEIQNYDDVMLNDRPGILNWVLEGYRKYRASGRKIDSSKSTDDTLDFYIANSDFQKYFFNGCTKQGDMTEVYVTKKELYEAYVEAARMKGAATVTSQTFKQNVPDKCGFTITDARVEIKGRQEHVFKGIRLRPKDEWFKDRDDPDFPKAYGGV